MTVEEKLKEKSFDMEDKKCDICHIPDQETPVINLDDAIVICKEALKKQREADAKIVSSLKSAIFPETIAMTILNAPEPEDL